MPHRIPKKGLPELLKKFILNNPAFSYFCSGFVREMSAAQSPAPEGLTPAP